MFHSVYIDGFRCLENFTLSFIDPAGTPLKSALFIGPNGSGKSNAFDALHFICQIARGKTLLKNLIRESDFPHGETRQAMTFEVECIIDAERYHYQLEIEQPINFYQPRIRKESLNQNGKTLFVREKAQTILQQKAEFTLDWHHAGLPLIFVRDENDPIARFRRWLSRVVVISPCPQRINLTSTGEDDTLARDAENFLNWMRKLLSDAPSLYTSIQRAIKQVMPDLAVFGFQALGREEKALFLEFRGEQGKTVRHDFCQLSDGERVLLLAATVSSTLLADQSLVCFWDEPDNYIASHELSHLITAWRRAAENHAGQLVISSHNPRVVAEFSDHNTYVFTRSSHAHPTRVTRLSEMNYDSQTLVDAFERGELFR